jgi:multiple sugar transport system permease protein
VALFPTVGRKQPKLRFAWWLIVAFLVLGILLHLFPFYFMIVTSFKSGTEVLRTPPTWWPQESTTAAWQLVVKLLSGKLSKIMGEPFGVYFLNSLFMTGMVLLIGLPVTSFAAYATSKLVRGRGSRYLFLFFIGTLMVPFAVTLIPSFLLTRNFPFALPVAPTNPLTGEPFPVLRIWNTPWAVIVPALFDAFSFLLFKGFFDTIPDSVIQAARVDGGSEFNIFRRIVLPMSIPVYAVAAWGMFNGVWDNFLWPALVLADEHKYPTSVAIYNIMNRLTASGATDAGRALGRAQAMKELLASGLSWNGLMVLGLLQTIPMFGMFLVCREYLLKGIRVRGLK